VAVVVVVVVVVVAVASSSNSKIKCVSSSSSSRCGATLITYLTQERGGAEDREGGEEGKGKLRAYTRVRSSCSAHHCMLVTVCCQGRNKRKYTNPKCEHGRQKRQCKECGTGRCEHGRSKYKCKDCGTGYCEHGRVKGTCTDCGTGLRGHGRRK
jgi:hypothetical protein